MSGGAAAFAFDPSISADGRFVAFASRPARSGRPGLRAGRRVWLHDRQTRRDGARQPTPGRRRDGRPRLRRSRSVSADGTRVAFTSTAGDLDRRKPGGLTGVFVRDLRAGTTTLLSTHAPRKVPPVAPPTGPRGGLGGQPAEHVQMLFCGLDA